MNRSTSQFRDPYATRNRVVPRILIGGGLLLCALGLALLVVLPEKIVGIIIFLAGASDALIGAVLYWKWRKT